MFKAKMETENKVKNQFGRSNKDAAKTKAQIDEINRQKQVRQSYINRTTDEDKARAAKEREVEEMEKMEMELIKKLQNTQAIQKDAYQQLENALKTPQK